MELIKLCSELAVVRLQMRTQRKWRHILQCNLNIYMDPLPHGVDTYWPTYPAACPTSMLGKHNAWISPQANVSEYKILENLIFNQNKERKQEHRRNKVAVEKRDWSGSSLLNLLILLFPA